MPAKYGHSNRILQTHIQNIQSKNMGTMGQDI